MTTDTPSVDDPTVMGTLLCDATALLFDFDGPICSVFAGIPATTIASKLRDFAVVLTSSNPPPNMQETDDPFEILKWAARFGDGTATHVERALRAYEVAAVATAQSVAVTHAILRHLRSTGIKVAVVSNNSYDSITRYLDQHDLSPCVSLISARTEANPQLLKPSGFLVDKAISGLGIAPSQAIFFGDSPTDVHAGKNAGVITVGYANRPGKVGLLKSAGPPLVITDMTIVLNALTGAID